MSKHYNLTVTDDNGKSVTTSNTSTEHPEEVLRMMQLAGMQSEPQCGMESVEENEYQPTPKNDKLDLDDYSKKSPESISKQPKKLQPSRGDNPLEYSLDENEIFESLMSEMEKVEEKKAKPDFADIDGDGDKKETMKKAAKDKKEKADESINEAKCDCDCGEDPCEECGESHHKVKESEPMGEETVNELNVPSDKEKVKAQIAKLMKMAKDARDAGDSNKAYSIERSSEMSALHKKLSKLGGDPDANWVTPEGGPLSYKKVGEYTYIVKDENGKEHKAEMGAMGDEQDNYSGDEIEQTMDQEGLQMLIRQAKMGAPVKEESPELARLRKLAGTEKIDEFLPVVGAVAGAVGRALISKGVKGTASRAAATTVASKLSTKKNNTTHNPHQ